MADGFLGRWARRKADAREGKPLVEPVEAPRLAPSPLPGAASVAPATPAAEAPVAPPLTLQDAQALELQSDFKPFIARGVDPAVRNAAMKKLFTDPHYNVMDRMDIYIDDYSQGDPLPQSMLRQMASAQFLNLVDDESNTKADQAAVTTAAPAPTATDTTTTKTTIASEDHAHPDLRLQQDDAPGCPDTGHGAA